jgi:dephospho-CoA kinase
MIILGLTGGIASGKSYVGALLAERGAVVLDADRHAHAVLAEPEVVAALVARWGEAIRGEDGSLRRREIAAKVFGQGQAAAAERAFLEGLVHPRVRQRLRADLEAAERAGAPLAVLDIPLLHESGWADSCDAVAFVDTPESLRIARVADRGWSAEELARREAAQLPLATKRERADHVLSGADPQSVRIGVDQLWAVLVGQL